MGRLKSCGIPNWQEWVYVHTDLSTLMKVIFRTVLASPRLSCLRGGVPIDALFSEPSPESGGCGVGLTHTRVETEEFYDGRVGALAGSLGTSVQGIKNCHFGITQLQRVSGPPCTTVY